MKTTQILMVSALAVILCGFGLASAKDEVTQAAAPVPASLAPVQKDNLGIDLSIDFIYAIYQDKDLLRGDGKGLKAKLGYNKIPYLYVWGSWETAEQRLYGQVAGDISLLGLGLGGRVKPIKEVPLTIFIEGGYFVPNSDLSGNDRCREGQGYYWAETFGRIGLHGSFWAGFNRYKYDISGAFGGAAGLEIKQPIYKNLSLNLAGAYRFLNLPESWDTFNHCGQNAQTKEKRSFNAGLFNIGLVYVF